jgi:RNA polymerase II subunit A-like phosphatase
MRRKRKAEEIKATSTANHVNVRLNPSTTPGLNNEDTEKLFRIIRYRVKEGDSVGVGQSLASCRRVEDNDELGEVQIFEVQSQNDGSVVKITVNEGETFRLAEAIITLDCCFHDVIVAGMCSSCGREVTSSIKQQKIDVATVNVEGGYQLQISRKEAMNVHEATVTRLFQTKKLSLVLDLDHTLLHCTDDPRALILAQSAAPGTLHTFSLDGKTLVLKVRPGLNNFLNSMKNYFEMYVYTAGTRAYAGMVCQIIDPTGAIFGERIVSRDDTPEHSRQGIKSLLRIFPVNDQMVVVVDDRDVWEGVGNLLTCKPFHYFRGS